MVGVINRMKCVWWCSVTWMRARLQSTILHCCLASSICPVLACGWKQVYVTLFSHHMVSSVSVEISQGSWRQEWGQCLTLYLRTLISIQNRTFSIVYFILVWFADECVCVFVCAHCCWQSGCQCHLQISLQSYQSWHQDKHLWDLSEHLPVLKNTQVVLWCHCQNVSQGNHRVNQLSLNLTFSPDYYKILGHNILYWTLVVLAMRFLSLCSFLNGLLTHLTEAALILCCNNTTLASFTLQRDNCGIVC